MGQPDSITRLIQITEEKTRAEERVGSLLQGIKEGQDRQISQLTQLANQVEMFGRCVTGLQQMLTVVAEYMAVLAGADARQVREITRELLQKTGMTFGEKARVDIAGDMVGGNKEA